MKFKQKTANETKLKEAEQNGEMPDTSERQLSTAQAETETLGEEALFIKEEEIDQKTEEPASASPAEQPADDVKNSGYAEKQLPNIWLAASVPLFFSISLITSHTLYVLRHLGNPHLQPEIIDAFLIGLFFISYYFFRIFSLFKSATLCTTLFKARTLRIEDSTTIYCIDLRKKNKSDNRPSLYLALTSPLRHGKLGATLRGIRAIFYTALFLIISIIAIPVAHGTFGWITGIVLSAITLIYAYQINRQDKDVVHTYNFALTDPALRECLKFPPKVVKSKDITVDFDAFADLERWIKHRFSQKSRNKTIFMCSLIVLFFAFDGFRLLENTMQSIAAFLSNSSVISASAGGAASLTLRTINYFNILLCFLGLGGMSAALYAMLQPTHLRLSSKGVSFLYNRRPFSKVRFTPWSEIKELRIVSRQGTTMLGEKQLEFKGDKNALIKFKLNCVDSISSRENILKSIESWAPNVKRDAEVIQALQRPAEQSYTDLWLQALSAPPKRDRLKPLIPNSSLLDGRYSVIKTLGLGGQGTAYLVRDTTNSQLVVLKEFILPIYVDINVRKAALERFENEARILKGLDYPQIVKLVDFFVEDHRGYLALEYIEGRDLKTIVQSNGKFSENDMIGYAIQMCEILKYLHNQDPPVIHRDFTPDNLILQNNGRLKLIDFNVAQQTNSTVTGTIVGKQCYLPPEQFQGEPVIQSDIYTMGATLFFMATGKEPEPISQSHPQVFNPDISAAFDLFVSKSTSIDANLRQQCAHDCLEELQEIQKPQSGE
jgi:serine/threonine protein kinase